MDKRRNFNKVKPIEGYLFVQEKGDNRKVYLVEQKDFDNSNESGDVGINCIVLEYMETKDEYIYTIKSPETIVILKRGYLEGMLFTN